MGADEVFYGSRPEWIPEDAWAEYLMIRRMGGFSDERKAEALEIFFADERLAGVWKSLDRIDHAPDVWNHLILGIINCLDCAPPIQRSSRAAPDEKIETLEKQKRVDALLAKAGKAADKLANLLWKLEENGGEMPATVYSGLAFIRQSIEDNNMARACCKRRFNEFERGERGLSSYERSYFPSTGRMIETLAKAMKAHPKSAEHFKNDPWLSSRQSSWKDYVRVLKSEFEVCLDCYGTAPHFTDTEWTSLLQALVSDSLTLQTVFKGLLEL
ncbi:MAG: hypothetical protein LBE85_03525 [Candidatus Accumulibacter sp.]|jgi:hypothetical protein|nr:hypothetical protein [Accumulibacter sp.]